jgi:hypothetical protein
MVEALRHHGGTGRRWPDTFRALKQRNRSRSQYCIPPGYIMRLSPMILDILKTLRQAYAHEQDARLILQRCRPWWP